MSAPYWGQLPEPRVARHGRRLSADKYPYQYDDDAQPPFRKPNRASIQTTATDDLTESTFSPHSPAASSFAAQGLAPRPPSYHPGEQVLLDAAEPASRATRASMTGYRIDPSSTPTPTVAPDVPRGPPVSYRHPHANDGLPYTFPASANNRLPPSHAVYQPHQEGDMELHGHYAGSQRHASADSTQLPVHNVLARRDGAGDGNGAGAGAAVSHDAATNSLATGSSERRRKFASDRSPLQRLELTLDSMSKEEKRARVEAAEQRARQRAAMKAGDAPSSQQARPHDRRTSAIVHDSYREAQVPPASTALPAAASLPREAPVLPSAPSTRGQPPSPYQPHDRADHGLPTAPQQGMAQPAQGAVDAEPGPPQRNLSFRERAARDVASPLLKQGPNPARPPVNGGGGFSLTRNGSNKLRKEPPGDRQPHREPTATASISGHISLATPARAPARLIPLSARNKELPPLPSPASSDGNGPQEIRSGGAKLTAWAPVQPASGVRRHVSEPVHGSSKHESVGDHRPSNAGGHLPPTVGGRAFSQEQPPAAHSPAPRDAAVASRHLERRETSPSNWHGHGASGVLYRKGQDMRPGQGLYRPPEWIDEWKTGTTGTLSGALLDLSNEPPATIDKSRAWWEGQGQGRGSNFASRQRKAEAFDGEYDDTNAPTRFKPPLYLKCGPLLRYCGIRRERFPAPGASGDLAVSEREIWRGSMMIATKDTESSYEIAPMLRLFVQDLELLPPPPHQVNGELPPEYVDPIAGHPKLGRRGETLYVRPVEHLEEAKDLSRDETDNGLFETTRSPPDVTSADGSMHLPGSFASRRLAVDIDGEKMQKYKDVRGFRLHAERGCTFWRFNIEVELRDRQQRIAYRINRGPCMGFWVPARGQAMNVMFYSCNGISDSAEPDELCGPDPMWRDVLNTHQSQPFHVMIGGGGQIYNDGVTYECELFDGWLDARNPLDKHTAPFTKEMQDEMEDFFLEHYCLCFSQGLYGLATSQIPMVNMYDGHDIFDGYGSYPHHDMNSPVFCGLGAVAFKYYMLFQHQSLVTETENSEPSWILGLQPGPYVKELSHSVFVSLGGRMALLAVDCRTERTERDVMQARTWEKITDRLYAEIRRGQVEHLLVLSAVPMAYPRLAWTENILASKFMNPVKALGKTGVFGKAFNRMDGGAENLDDFNDHWTAKNHKQERSILLEDMQDLAIDKSLRLTILSGDVHMAAVGQFYSNPKLGLAKHRDPRYMPNITSSAMANAPPSELVADAINRRIKVHRFDRQTDESMIPIFQQGVDGRLRNNKHLLPHRNWCSIRRWTPGSTPPPTPPLSSDDGRASRSTTGAGAGAGRGILRRLSWKNTSTPNRLEASRESVRGPRPPVSGGLGLFRSLSRRSSSGAKRPGILTRTMSLGRGDTQDRGYLGVGWRSSASRPDDGGINGQWGAESDDDYDSHQHHSSGAARPSGLRGGGTHDEYQEGDESYFSARMPQRAQASSGRAAAPGMTKESNVPMTRPFHRTPTGLSTKQMRKVDRYEVDVEGGLDIVFNVEVNAKDPAGITVPYRLLVPRLQYDFDAAEDELVQKSAGPELSKLKRLFSLRKRPDKAGQSAEGDEQYLGR